MGADSYKITKYCVEPLHHLGEQSKVGVVAACRAVHLLIALPPTCFNSYMVTYFTM